VSTARALSSRLPDIPSPKKRGKEREMCGWFRLECAKSRSNLSRNSERGGKVGKGKREAGITAF